MPFYDYRCSEGHEFEVFQRMSEDPVESCRAEGCEAPAERVLGATHGKVVGGTPRHHQRAPRK